MTAILVAIGLFLMMTGSAQARDRIDPAYQGGDITVCRGLLTSSGTCIGSESNVVPPSYEGTLIYRPQRDRDQQDDDHQIEDDQRD